MAGVRERPKGQWAMLKESLLSVKVTWFDYDAVWDAVRRFAQELVDQFEEVEEVRVFGSLVRRECVPGSDVDIFIILRDHPLPFHERIPLFLPRHLMPVSVDVFPYTRREVEQMLREGNHFVRQAVEEGIILAFRRAYFDV